MVRVPISGHQHVHWIEEQRKRNRKQVADRRANQVAAVLRSALLQALATEHIRAVEVVHFVLHAADPAELVLAFGADHMIAPALLLLHYEAALRTVGHRVLHAQILEVLLHGHIELRFTILLPVVGQAAFHTDFVLAALALTVVRIRSREAGVGLLLDFLLDLHAVHGGARSLPMFL